MAAAEEVVDFDSEMDPDAEYELYIEDRGAQFPEGPVTRAMMTFLPPFFLTIGTIGNIFIAIIMIRMMRKVLSTCIYVFVSVMIDTLVLYVRCGNDWIYNMIGMDIAHIAKHSSKSLCKIYPFVSDWALHLSMWLGVAMAVETTLVTLRPQRLMQMCRHERSRAVILLIIVLLVCVNAHNFWTYALIVDDRTERVVCTNARTGNQLSNEFRQIAWPIIDILVSDLLPICITFSCSVMLITRRSRRAEQVKLMENTWKAYSIDAKVARQLQIAFISLSMLQVVLLFPKLGYDIFVFVGDPELNLLQLSYEQEARKRLAYAICSTCVYLFLSCKVFVFFVVSRAFRSDFLALLLCRRCSSHRSGATNRVSTQQPLLNTVSANSNHVCRPDPTCRKIYSTTSEGLLMPGRGFRFCFEIGVGPVGILDAGFHGFILQNGDTREQQLVDCHNGLDEIFWKVAQLARIQAPEAQLQNVPSHVFSLVPLCFLCSRIDPRRGIFLEP
ncbi:hypothetical protein CAPTEDRAFT_202366 [Capitella teleta]|uniref:G-protein coupled receptors family 1 profile domain-containing protein n=1 Tax=Capitella teleta TaxID=283909 RepID=R7VEZ0_CAPTE|nr:hypothetical protein CAPTEDRAFT_202366 [Capitella teleta]|eukprot:ELU17152.1 hypothetical protein CAPTEDRAFT_202366 [Capitella teleta]